MCLFRENRGRDSYLCFGKALEMLGELGEDRSQNTAVLLNNLGCCLAKVGGLDASLDAFAAAEECFKALGGQAGDSPVGLEIRTNLNRVLAKGVSFQIKQAPAFKFYWRNPADFAPKPTKK